MRYPREIRDNLAQLTAFALMELTEFSPLDLSRSGVRTEFKKKEVRSALENYGINLSKRSTRRFIQFAEQGGLILRGKGGYYTSLTRAYFSGELPSVAPASE